MTEETARNALIPPAVDTVPINIAVLDTDGTILQTNRAWREFGRENDVAVRPDATGINYLEVTEGGTSEAARTVAAGLRELLDGEREHLEVEYPCHSPEERRWFLMRAAPFTLEDDRFVAVAHIDVTERVQSERDRARFERAIETAGHAIFIANTDGEITYVNPAFEDITGYGPAEAIGQSPSLLKSGEMDDAFYADLWETILAGEVWEGTIVNRRKSGELYYAHETIAPVLDEADELLEFVAIQTDITEVTEARKQIEKLDNILRHDLRNRLNVARGYADLIDEDPATAPEYASVIADTLTELLWSVEKVRDLQQFLSETTTPECHDVAAIARAVVTSQREVWHDATIDLDAPERTDAIAVSELDLALEELLQNAVVHSDTATPQVTVTVEAIDGWVEVRVADDGPGIPEMEHVSLELDAISDLYHDSGFGLNLAYWITRRSGGRLLFADNSPRGAVVTIRLPRPNEGVDRDQ